MSGAKLWRAKWMGDGCADLPALAARLREEATRLSALAKKGWTLDGPVSDDYGTLLPPPRKAPARRGK